MSMHCHFPSPARLGLTVWLLVSCVAGLEPDGAACASTAASLLARKAEVHESNVALSEDVPITPINFTNGSNVSMNETLSGLLKNNVLHNMHEINTLPDMENRSNTSNASNSSSSNSSKSSNSTGNGTETENTTSSRPKHGFGELAVNLEFITLKLAQLETIAELQQLEIHKLLKTVDAQDAEIQALKKAQNASLAQKPDAPAPSFEEHQARENARVEEAQEVFKRVVQKHLHQRQKREYVTPFSGPARKGPAKAQAKAQTKHKAQAKPGARRGAGPAVTEAALLERATSSAEGNMSALDESVSGKWVSDVVGTVGDTFDTVGGAITDGTGLVGNALGDAYANAADQISFVANTVIDTVEMAVTILLRGFTDWNAGCPDMQWPSMSVNSNGLHVDWGKQKCYIRLLGQSIDLINFDFGDTRLTWPEPIKTVTRYGLEPIKAVVNIGREVASCASAGGVEDVFKCFGNKLLQVVPPLNFLNRIGDVIQEFIETFAKVAAAVINTLLKDSSSLIQQAVNSSFPAVGAPPVLHHAARNMQIKTHSQRRPGTSEKKSASDVSAAQEGAKVRARGDGDDKDDSDGSISFGVHDNAENYATKLLTQFGGKEIDTSSCLAFAPKTRRGSDNKVTKRDWQVGSGEDFIQLEPWAVPCDNTWMQENPEKWEGYSYTWESAIEKCVTVSYSMSTQPVLAFVGGLEFDLLPSPLTEMETTVCWPDKQPGGVDLSVLRTVILSGGVQLFSRTMRLNKRFGSNTDFTPGNVKPVHETWRNPLGIAKGSHAVEDGLGLEAMSREALFQLNASEQAREPAEETEQRRIPQSKAGAGKTEELIWSEEEVYLASMLYGRYMNMTKTSERHGHEARSRLRLMQEDQEASEGGGVAGEFELFSFANPGLVSFQIRGILANNDLQIGLKVSFGPFTSPEKRITLVNIVDHYRLVLGAMPFVSVDTRVKALEALKNFTLSDAPKAAAGSSQPVAGAAKAKIGQVWADPTRNNYLVFSTRQSGQVTSLWNSLKGGDMTWEVMMRFIETPPDQTAIMGSYEFNSNTYSTSNRRRSMGLYVRPDGRTFVGGNAGSSTGTPVGGPNVFDGKWRHVVLVLSKTAGKATYYIDGVKINECGYSPGSDDVAVDGTIAIGGGHLNRFFQNEVSRFAIWSRAWSQADATKALTCTVDTQGLKVLYTLDGGYEDLVGQYSDLRLGTSNGSPGFKTCSSCKHCATYVSATIKVR